MKIKLNKFLKLSVFSLFITYTNISDIEASNISNQSLKQIPLYNVNLSSKNPALLKLGQGSLFNVYGQDPSTDDPTAYNFSSGLFSTKPLFIKQVFIQQDLKNGLSDADMEIVTSPVLNFTPDSNGDFTSYKEGTYEFDAAHLYARVRETYDMWYATLLGIFQDYKDTKAEEKIQYWDGRSYGKLMIYPHAGFDTNAYYSRSETTRHLKFFDFISQEKKVSSRRVISTCRHTDVGAHEASHSLLDILQADYWYSDTIETGGLHEAFGDLGALFFILVQDDLVDKLVVSTKGDLHRQNFASFMAEEFGRGLGFSSSLRNADTDYKLDEVEPEVHALAEVFTGAIYDVLVKGYDDAFKANHGRRRMTQMLQDVGDHLRGMLLHAIVKIKTSSPTFRDIANEMLDLTDFYAKNSSSYVKDYSWKQHLHDEFSRRGVFEEPSSKRLKAAQIRSNLDKKHGICGTHYHKILKENEEGY